MNKRYVYIVIIILILVFFTKDIDFKDIFYKETDVIKNPSDLLVLVNKNYKLAHDYIPDNLELINTMYANDNQKLKIEAKLAFERLSKDAKEENFKIVAVSTYRDYDYQEKLFDKYVKESGEEYALSCSAKAGHSEHQTGLALDVMGSNNDYNYFEETKEFLWMRENAHKYGFILRYPSGKEHITGYKYEPWHYRYVGIDVATIIYNEDLTLEEFYFNYLKKNN